MDNYHYIITGLPELFPEFPARQFSYEETAASIREKLSRSDCRKIDWLEYGFDSSNLSRHFYHSVKRQKSILLRDYFMLDKDLRNAAVMFVASKDSKARAEKYLISPEEPSHLFDSSEIAEILRMQDLMERELAMDRYRWNRISDITTGHYFDIEVILGFLAKGLIVRRWLSLDSDSGAALFRNYVDEIRGSFNKYANKQQQI